ncbi:MAG: MBL fold metallo-hydrolase [Myxococcales bacterium]|nr:MBL fold metallo-hydrolase [Myxococcales bacterium]USN49933.1 MAG: MBL fold metallo-hydrolase [Myxococcales bacterium]
MGIVDEPRIVQSENFEILSLATETVPPYTTTNTILYGKNNFWVIDPATKDPHHQEFLIRHIQMRLNKKQKMLGILLSHHHSDHIGAVSLLSSNFKSPILAHKFLCGKVDFSVDRTVEEGEHLALDEKNSLEVIYTPGHAESHVVFFDRSDGCLIAGDMITSRGTILIPPNSGSLKLYLFHLERIASLPIKTIIPAHGEAIVEQPHFFLLNAIKHRLERIEQIYRVLENSQQLIDASDITNTIYQRKIEDRLMFFAQLSVESGLYWLKENNLALQENYRWKLSMHTYTSKEKILLNPLKEINERLRYT